MAVNIEKITEPLVLGEGPHWDDRLQCLYFVNIRVKALHKYVPATKEHTKTTFDGSISFVIPIEGTTDQFLVGSESKFLVVQWDGAEGSKVTVLRELGEVDSETTINDGKVDPRGRIYAGTLCYDSTNQFRQHRGSLYRIDNTKGRKIETVAERISLSNGLAWDLQEKAFYYIDSLEKNIRRYDYDVETGELSNLKYIFDLEKNYIRGIPDGMTIDTDGNLWVAVFGGSCVLNIDPKSGELLQEVSIPASQVTSVAFGGPGLDILFVTTASLNLGGGAEMLPPNGSTFVVSGLGVKGHPHNNYKL